MSLAGLAYLLIILITQKDLSPEPANADDELEPPYGPYDFLFVCNFICVTLKYKGTQWYEPIETDFMCTVIPGINVTW